MLLVKHNEIFYELTGNSQVNFVAILQEFIFIYFSPYTFD